MFFPAIDFITHYPTSPARLKALDACENALFKEFELTFRNLNAELKDAVHYTLFKVKDRLSMSAAWMISKELGLNEATFTPLLCSFEMVRCALGASIPTTKREVNYIDPYLNQQAQLSLASMAFETILRVEQENCMKLLALFANRFSFARSFSNLHDMQKHSSRYKKETPHIEHPIFNLNGAYLDFLSSNENQDFEALFNDLSLYAYLVTEVKTHTETIQISPSVDITEMMDKIKTLDAKFKQQAAQLGVLKSVEQIVNPFNQLLESHLQ